MGTPKTATLDEIRKLIREETVRASRRTLPSASSLGAPDQFPDFEALRGRMPAYCDTQGAAIYCDLSEAGLVTMRRQRRGPPFIRCTKRMLRYSYDALDVWMEGHRVEAAAAS